MDVEEINKVSSDIYAKDYSHGEYCHEQSFNWGFQEAVDEYKKC